MPLVASWGWLSDLSFYQNVRQASQRGVVGADTVYADLNARFPGRPLKPANKPAVTAKA